ncbi:MAG: hypothetical protein ABR974_00305 [Bacteroidales bacterium]
MRRQTGNYTSALAPFTRFDQLKVLDPAMSIGLEANFHKFENNPYF